MITLISAVMINDKNLVYEILNERHRTISEHDKQVAIFVANNKGFTDLVQMIKNF